MKCFLSGSCHEVPDTQQLITDIFFSSVPGAMRLSIYNLFANS